MQTAHIGRGYRLVPEGDANLALFQQMQAVGGYIARVSGNRYQIDLACHPIGDGNQVNYGYSLRWIRGQPFPWIEIKHVVPNHIYHKGTLDGLRTNLNVLQGQKANIDGRLDGVRGIGGERATQREANSEVTRLEAEVLQRRNSITQLEESQAHAELSQLLAVKRQELERTQKEKADLENNTRIDESIRETTLILGREEDNRQKLKIKMRNIAIIIKNQWNSALLLKKFAARLVTEKGDVKNDAPLSQTLTGCKEFLKLFNECQEKLRSDLYRDYGFELASPDAQARR